jgi:YD repeat-containing protein
MYAYNSAGQVTKKRLRMATSLMDLDAVYTYDNEGRVTSIQYPGSSQWDGTQWTTAPGPVYNYGYDGMGRPASMVEPAVPFPTTYVDNVQYGPANEKLSVSGVQQETYEYNSRLQLTRLASTGILDMEYSYSTTGQNNGQISKSNDRITGEEVSYAYDSLNRLISAVTTGPEWGLSFSYDGFGNKTAQTVTKGSGPVMNVAYDAGIFGLGFPRCIYDRRLLSQESTDKSTISIEAVASEQKDCLRPKLRQKPYNVIRRGVLVHEVMHSLGLIDSQLLTALGYSINDASGRVTTRLASDCFGVKR